MATTTAPIATATFDRVDRDHLLGNSFKGLARHPPEEHDNAIPTPREWNVKVHTPCYLCLEKLVVQRWTNFFRVVGHLPSIDAVRCIEEQSGGRL